MSDGTSFSVLTADIISLLLLGTLYYSNKQRMSHDRDMKFVTRMMVITAISNVADCCVYYFDGNRGLAFKTLVLLSGTWLFAGNVLFGYTWAKFIITHMNIPFTAVRKKFYQALRLIAWILLIINLFYPLVFSNSDGVYRRGPAYIIFLLFAFFYIVDSAVLYVRSRKKIGTLKIFPVQVFLAPVIIGVVIQAFFMEIAITWTSIAIAIAGVMSALKNELIFIDSLTGLYNRVYLTYLQKEAQKKKSEPFAGIMLDLNGFKQINDNYGHSEGDAALMIVADLLRKSFCEYGIVTRYAGDEFVVVLNTTDERLIRKLIARAKEIFEDENKKNDKPYQLSASIGYAVSDLSKESIDDFMNRIDKEMYQDKLTYYKQNDRRQK